MCSGWCTLSLRAWGLRALNFGAWDLCTLSLDAWAFVRVQGVVHSEFQGSVSGAIVREVSVRGASGLVHSESPCMVPVSECSKSR